MQSITQTIKTYLLKQEGWLFLNVLLFYSFVFMQVNRQLGWAEFYGTFLLLVFFFSPLLLFVFWRKRVESARLSARIAWVTAFVILPLVFTLIWPDHLADIISWYPLGIDPPLAAERMGGLLVWITLVGLELLLRWNHRAPTTRRTNYLHKYPVQYWAILVVAVFTLLIVPASNYFQAYVEDFTLGKAILVFLSAAGQAFIIYLSYYLIYYVHHNFLFNGLLRQKGFVAYLLGAIGFLLLFVPIQGLFIRLFPAVDLLKIHPLGIIPEVFSDMNFALPIGFFLLSLPFIIGVEWYRQANAISRLEQEKTATELQLLKQQINPHFFFNTLNNLYAMSLTQEKETPETILQLSELMRYVIYKGQEERVPLKLEIKYLRDYLDLQKIRLRHDLDIQFSVNIEDEDQAVPPLLFIILVENAFKHGIEPAGANAFLHMALRQNENSLDFRCRNSYDPTYKPASNGGLGLPNLRRRLVMAFPDRHHLKTEKLENEFIAELSLEL